MLPIRATYRLQLNSEFGFARTHSLIPYLARLGVSHLYLSPVFAARRGSTHGYDTVDHCRINPEIGTRSQFEDLVGELRRHDMGVVLDFVPNHMGIGTPENEKWFDVLAKGRDSAFAHWFDIDFDAGPILVPILDRPLRLAIAEAQVKLAVCEAVPQILVYNATPLPLRDTDCRDLISEFGDAEQAARAFNADPRRLHDVITRQHWRLSHYGEASYAITYRRFFAVSDLAGIRIEDREVFDAVHALLFELADADLVDAVRIDHIDGLRNPAGYLERLRAGLPSGCPIYVEKILASDEALPTAWPVAGTTGYEFGALLTRLLIPAQAEAEIAQAARKIGGSSTAIADIEHACKHEVMQTILYAELDKLARLAEQVARGEARFEDLTAPALRRGLAAIVAELDVYRTYIVPGEPANISDRRRLAASISRARRSARDTDPRIFELLGSALTGQIASGAELLARFQQYTGPVAAKGVEDTALYRDIRLLALNEVGADPAIFSITPQAFHAANVARLETWPGTMLSTSTHDTKRGEDARIRIAAIADAPHIWISAATKLNARLVEHDATVAPEDRYVMLQLMLGAWPFADPPADDIAERLDAALEKSLREARLRTDWLFPDTDYEGRVKSLLHKAIQDPGFRELFEAMQRELAPMSARKALIQAAIKFTVPGIPDIYRGAEGFEQSLVDPDNRRPLDFEQLSRQLDDGPDWKDPCNPATKLGLVHALLQLRRDQPELLLRGSYEPLDLDPPLFGFDRIMNGRHLRLIADLTGGALASDHLPDFGEFADATGAGIAASAAFGFVVLINA